MLIYENKNGIKFIYLYREMISLTFKEMDIINTSHTEVTASNAQFSNEGDNKGNLEFTSSTLLQ